MSVKASTRYLGTIRMSTEKKTEPSETQLPVFHKRSEKQLIRLSFTDNTPKQSQSPSPAPPPSSQHHTAGKPPCQKHKPPHLPQPSFSYRTPGTSACTHLQTQTHDSCTWAADASASRQAVLPRGKLSTHPKFRPDRCAREPYCTYIPCPTADVHTESYPPASYRSN